MPRLALGRLRTLRDDWAATSDELANRMIDEARSFTAPPRPFAGDAVLSR